MSTLEISILIFLATLACGGLFTLITRWYWSERLKRYIDMYSTVLLSIAEGNLIFCGYNPENMYQIPLHVRKQLVAKAVNNKLKEALHFSEIVNLVRYIDQERNPAVNPDIDHMEIGYTIYSIFACNLNFENRNESWKEQKR